MIKQLIQMRLMPEKTNINNKVSMPTIKTLFDMVKIYPKIVSKITRRVIAFNF
jgi:hypothetical protein